MTAALLLFVWDELYDTNLVRHADTVEGGEDDFTNFQSKRLSDRDLAELGYLSAEAGAPAPHTHSPDDVEDTRDPKTEKKHDKVVEDTFPASDPSSSSTGTD